MNLLEVFTGPKQGAVADPRIAKIRSRLNSLAVFFIVCILLI
jgi:hypothetical protein